MITKVFAVYDKKAKCFSNPFFNSTIGSAIREFGDAVQDKSNPRNVWAHHPGDFSLYEIGEYNDENAMLTSHEIVRLLSNGSDFEKEDKQLKLPKFENVTPEVTNNADRK